jgi:hypothetical protein
MAISPTDIQILFTNYDIIIYFLNLAACSEHFISRKHRILATFNINKNKSILTACMPLTLPKYLNFPCFQELSPFYTLDMVFNRVAKICFPAATLPYKLTLLDLCNHPDKSDNSLLLILYQSDLAVFHKTEIINKKMQNYKKKSAFNFQFYF